MKTTLWSLLLLCAWAIIGCGNKQQPQPLTDTTTTVTTPNSNTPPAAPAPVAFTENTELMQFLKDSLTNAASLQKLLADDPSNPSKESCDLPNKNWISDCGYLSKYETKDTIFVVASNVPESSRTFLVLLFKFSPSGKLLAQEELDRVTAEE